MTPQTLKALDHRLQHFLQDLVEPMGRSERRHWARVYVQGLMLDGERKSIEPRRLASLEPMCRPCASLWVKPLVCTTTSAW